MAFRDFLNKLNPWRSKGPAPQGGFRGFLRRQQQQFQQRLQGNFPRGPIPLEQVSPPPPEGPTWNQEQLAQLEQFEEQPRNEIDGFVHFGEPLAVSSSNVREIRYDADQSQLQIEFHNGSIYQYESVSMREAEAFAIAASKGKWVWRNLRRLGTVYGYNPAHPLGTVDTVVRYARTFEIDPQVFRDTDLAGHTLFSADTVQRYSEPISGGDTPEERAQNYRGWTHQQLLAAAMARGYHRAGSLSKPQLIQSLVNDDQGHVDTSHYAAESQPERWTEMEDKRQIAARLRGGPLTQEGMEKALKYQAERGCDWETALVESAIKYHGAQRFQEVTASAFMEDFQAGRPFRYAAEAYAVAQTAGRDNADSSDGGGGPTVQKSDEEKKDKKKDPSRLSPFQVKQQLDDEMAKMSAGRPRRMSAEPPPKMVLPEDLVRKYQCSYALAGKAAQYMMDGRAEDEDQAMRKASHDSYYAKK